MCVCVCVFVCVRACMRGVCGVGGMRGVCVSVVVLVCACACNSIESSLSIALSVCLMVHFVGSERLKTNGYQVSTSYSGVKHK